MSIDLELPDRLSAPLSLDALTDLLEFYQCGGEPHMSPPLALGWDIHRQWPSEGFAVWRDLMLEYEPPLLEHQLLQGDQRQAVTLEQYEAALVEEWALYAREKHWLDQLIVDVMHSERERGYEPCGDAWDATEAILNDLAAKCGAKRAAFQAEEDAREERRRKRLHRYYDLDDAGYAKWVAAGLPYSDAKKIERWTERRFAEHLRKAKEMPVVPFPAPAAPSAPKHVFETVSDLRSMPPQTWLVDRWIPQNSVGIIFGRYATGKSFVGFDLLLHLAYGLKEWHGVKLSGIPCHVLLIAREGHIGFRRRIDAFKKHHGIVDDTDRIVFMRCPVNFGDTAQFNELKTDIEKCGRQFQVVMVDTVGRALPGEDMFDPKSITRFMEHLQQLGEISKGVAIGIHHENKSGDVMGSIYFNNNSDFMFRVTREGDPESDPLRRGKISCVKQKDGEDGWTKDVSYKFIETEPNGEGSLVIDSVTKSAGTGEAKGQLSDRQANMIDALREATAAHGKLGRVHVDKWRDVAYNRGFLDDEDATNRSKQFQQAKAALIKKRLVHVDKGLAGPISSAARALTPMAMTSPPPVPSRD